MTGRPVNSVFTEYAKVTDSHLVQLEIHVLGDSEKDGAAAVAWFNKRTHVKEITAALMPVMHSRVSCVCEQKSAKRLRRQTETFQVDAPSLRLAYRFHQRNHGNECVIISCTERNLRSKRRRSLQVFSEKLVVHAYHREGFSRMEAINREVLNFKYEATDPWPSGPARPGTSASVYFDKHQSRPQPHQQTLRNIVKKSGPKLSKLRRPKGVEETDSVESVDSAESVWTMEEERDKRDTVPPVESVSRVPDTLGEDPLTAIDDTGLYQREAASDMDSESARGSESSYVIGCTSSDSVRTEDSATASVCSRDGASSGLVRVESGQDTRHTQTRSVAPSVVAQEECRDKSSERNRQLKSHSERDMSSWKCKRDDSELKDKCPKDNLPKDKGHKDKFPKDNFPKDKFPKDKSPTDNSPTDKSPKDKVLKDKSPKDKSPKDKSPKDKSLKDKSPKDKCPKDKSPKDKCPKDKSPKEQRSYLRSKKENFPKDNCHKEEFSKDKSSKDKVFMDKCPKNTSPMDKSPKDKSPADNSPNNKSLKDKSLENISPKDMSPKEKSLKEKCPKEKSLKEKCPKDKSLKEKCPKDKSAKEQRSYLRSQRMRSAAGSGTSDSDCVRPSKGATTEQRKLRLKKRVTPSTPPVPADSSECDVQGVDSGSPAWKMSDDDSVGTASSPGKRGTKRTKPAESSGPSQCHQSTRCGATTSPVSQKPGNTALVPAVSPVMTKKGVTTTRRVTAKDAKKTSSLLSRRRRSKHRTVSSKLEAVFQDLETDFNNEGASKLRNAKQPGKKPANKKTSAKLATLLKEMEEEDVHVNSSDFCRDSTAKAAKRPRIAKTSNSYLITERNSLDQDPFQGPTGKCASRPDLKVKKNKLSGDASEALCQAKRCKLSERDGRPAVSESKSPVLGTDCVSPSELTNRKAGQGSVSGSECSATCQSVSQSASPIPSRSVSQSPSPVLGSQKMLHKLRDSDSCQSVSPDKSRLLGTKCMSPSEFTKKSDTPRSCDSDSCQSVSPSKSQSLGMKSPSPSKMRRKLDKLRSSDRECSDRPISPSKSHMQESELVSPSNLRKKKILKLQTTKNCLVDDLRGLPLKPANKDNKRSFLASPENSSKFDSFLKKTKSDTYRMSPERRKRLAELMSSDSDYESFLTNGNSRSVASRKSGSMGRVNQYFQQAMRYETRSRLQEKIPDKQDEDAENVLIKDLLGDCFVDETKSKPVSVQILDKGQERINAEISQIKNVCDLTEEQLLFLVKKNTQYLKDIFEGKVSCQRHDDYKEGGKTRIALNYQVRLNLFSDEQPDVVVSALVSIFCKKTGSKYLDYVLKVLLPETLIKVYMDLNGASYRDTEDTMAQARPMEQDF